MTADLNRVAAHCPTCGDEYRQGFDVCADDGTPLEPGPAPETIQAPPSVEQNPPPLHQTGARWVKLGEYALELRARLVAGRLEAEGIPVILDPEMQHEPYGPGTNALLGKGVELYVPENRLLEARDLIIELERT